MKPIVFVFILLILLTVNTAGETDVCSLDSSEEGTSCSMEESTEHQIKITHDTGLENRSCIVYFWGQGCPKCAEIKPFMEDIEEQYADRVRIHWLEVYRNKTNYGLLNEYTMNAGIPVGKRGIPFIVVGDSYLMGVGPIKENLENEILSLNLNESSCPFPERMSCHNAEYNPTQLSPVREIQLTLPLVLITGLVDGINPCAFAVLIFLLAYLTTLGKSKKRMIKVGVAYITSIYLTYLSIGIGLFSFMYVSGLTGVIYKISAVTAILAGLINIKDYFWYGRWFTLKIPESKAESIKNWASKMTVPAALILGVIVGVHEMPCSGIVYLAVISMLSSTTTLWKGMPYLLAYNLMFILPLIAVFILAYTGVTTKKLEEFRQKEKNRMKLIMGILMLTLGGIMLYTTYL